jgi:hypothetical protein
MSRISGWTTVGALAALVVAVGAAGAEAPTLHANPEIVGAVSPLVLEGMVPSGRAGEDVVIEARECRATFFRTYAGTKTQGGGTFREELPGINSNTYFRARVNGATSAAIYVRRRAFVGLEVKTGGRFIGRVFSPFLNMHGRRIRLERFSPSGWVLIRTAKLRRIAGPEYQARFVVRTRGLQLRAAVTDAAVRPCYVAGVSPIARS